MKIKILFFLILLSLNAISSDNLNFKMISKVPILSEGRIKPLDTFARSTLLKFYNKSSLKNLSAMEWLIELLLDQKKAYNRPIFKIVNDDVLKAIDLKKSEHNTYNFIELYSSFQKIQILVNELNKKNSDELEPSQKQLIELNQKLILYLDLSRSLSMIFPEIEIPEDTLRQRLELPGSENTTYFELIKKQHLLRALVVKSLNSKNSPEIKRLAYILKHLDFIQEDSFSTQLKILPLSIGAVANNDWLSPWQIDFKTTILPEHEKIISLWSNLYTFYHNQSGEKFNNATQEILNYSNTLLLNSKTSPARLSAETQMNNLDLLYKSIIFYILGFLLLCLNLMSSKKIIHKLSFTLLVLGSILHFSHIVLRCFILLRPPVSNLYESTIFVSLVAVIFSIFFEIKRRDGIGILIGSLIGSILLSVGFGYQKDGDTLGMLVAVLDTNFWLATHVVTISIGYGCCLVASLLSHIYLIQSLNLKNTSSLPSLEKNIHGSVLFSLFFTVLGTILGGIWADQSWGRFWGWDPKENGALLICLWLIWVVHGRLCGKLKKRIYAATVCLTSLIVVIAWFGVNLLSVGLHSYGFTENIAHNILYFGLAEIGFLFLIFAFNHCLKCTPSSK